MGTDRQSGATPTKQLVRIKSYTTLNLNADSTEQSYVK